jgi:hypothetical protein
MGCRSSQGLRSWTARAAAAGCSSQKLADKTEPLPEEIAASEAVQKRSAVEPASAAPSSSSSSVRCRPATPGLRQPRRRVHDRAARPDLPVLGFNSRPRLQLRRRAPRRLRPAQKRAAGAGRPSGGGARVSGSLPGLRGGGDASVRQPLRAARPDGRLPREGRGDRVQRRHAHADGKDGVPRLPWEAL